MSFAKKGKSKGHKSFVMLARKMLSRNEEWKELSSAAKLFYIYLKSKYNGINNGSIKLHYSELKGVKGISSHSTISKAIKELEKKEWIKRTKQGGLYRHINEYELTGNYDEYLK